MKSDKSFKRMEGDEEEKSILFHQPSGSAGCVKQHYNCFCLGVQPIQKKLSSNEEQGQIVINHRLVFS